MKKLTFYEQVGIVIPGSVLLFGLLFFVPALKELLAKDGVSFGGFPSDWVVKKQSALLSDEQRESLLEKTRTRLRINIPTIIGIDRKKWFPISRQIYTDVEINGKSDRLETFNANYGLNRGLAAGCLALACVAFLSDGWRIGLGLLAICVIYAYRAYRFGVHYARELYLQFLSINSTSVEQ
jgi:hypothetical protein